MEKMQQITCLQNIAKYSIFQYFLVDKRVLELLLLSMLTMYRNCNIKPRQWNGKRYLHTSPNLRASTEGTLNYFKKAWTKCSDPNELKALPNLRDVAAMVMINQYLPNERSFSKPLNVNGTEYVEGKPFRVAPRLNWALSQFSLHCTELSPEPESQSIMYYICISISQIAI